MRAPRLYLHCTDMKVKRGCWPWNWSRRRADLTCCCIGQSSLWLDVVACNFNLSSRFEQLFCVTPFSCVCYKYHLFDQIIFLFDRLNRLNLWWAGCIRNKGLHKDIRRNITPGGVRGIITGIRPRIFFKGRLCSLLWLHIPAWLPRHRISRRMDPRSNLCYPDFKMISPKQQTLPIIHHVESVSYNYRRDRTQDMQRLSLNYYSDHEKGIHSLRCKGFAQWCQHCFIFWFTAAFVG